MPTCPLPSLPYFRRSRVDSKLIDPRFEASSNNMGHRQFYMSPIPESNYYQVWSHQIPHSCVHSENASFGLVGNNVTVNGVTSGTYVNSGLQLSNHIHSCCTTISPDYRAAAGTSSQSFMPILSASSSTQFPPHCAHHQNSLHNGFISGNGSRMVNIKDSRAGSKRKTRAMPMMFDEVNTSGYHSGERFAGRDYYIGGSSSRSNSCPSVSGEGFQRNVRSRLSHSLHYEVYPTRVHPLSTPQSSCPIGFVPVRNITGQSTQMPESVPSHRMIISPGIGTPNSTGGINVPYYRSMARSTNRSVLVRTPCGPFVQCTGADSSSYDPIVSYRPSSTHPTIDFQATSIEVRGHSVVEPLRRSRHSRPLSIGGRSNDRFSMVRNGYRTFADDSNARSIWVSEGVVLRDHSHEPWSLLDQNRDMRLDIENMSYEGMCAQVCPRIQFQSVLTETTYNLRDCIKDDQKEEKCAICLEEYRDYDNLGRLNCHHEFHANCIKKWLPIKNACPICKASAATHTKGET